MPKRQCYGSNDSKGFGRCVAAGDSFATFPPIKIPVSSIELSLTQERLRRSRYSFNLAMSATELH
ncbi:hypothetical protein [Plectonema radiosum]|uniref:hypothetical protein n=1 Tax=Plectonema radiosum TaxID=945768 RepID=UPI001D159EC1|nr:hypothetical protein [Plectonema radiosum]